MTIGEAISAIDSLKPNVYSDAEKMSWLSKVDGSVLQQIIGNRETVENSLPYTEETPSTTQLLIPDSNSDIYTFYMSAMIDFFNLEYAGYNNAIAMYNQLFDDYKAFYSRDKKPKKIKREYF